MLASGAAAGAVAQGSAAVGTAAALAAGAKVLLSTAAIDIGSRLIAGGAPQPPASKFGGLFGKKERRSSSDSTAGALPLLSRKYGGERN